MNVMKKIRLEHGDRVILEGYRGTIYSLRKVCAEFHMSPRPTEPEAWIQKAITVLVESPEDREDWSKAVILSKYDIITLEDNDYSIYYRGPYSDMATLLRIKA